MKRTIAFGRIDAAATTIAMTAPEAPSAGALQPMSSARARWTTPPSTSAIT